MTLFDFVAAHMLFCMIALMVVLVAISFVFMILAEAFVVMIRGYPSTEGKRYFIFPSNEKGKW